FRFPRRFRLIELEVFVPELLLLLLLLLLFVLLVLMFGCSVTVALVGGLIPYVLALLRLTCMIATSTRTSDFDLSRSSISLVARAIWSCVPRTTMAFWVGNCWTRAISRICRIAFTMSCNSCGVETLER